MLTKNPMGMNFTDRFIKLPSRIYDADQAEYKKQEECDQLSIGNRVDPNEIESYRPAIPRDVQFGRDGLVGTAITMKSGDEHLIYLSIQEFETRMNEYYAQSDQNQKSI